MSNVTKPWVLYEINVQTKSGPLMTMEWGKSKKKALKDALKKLFRSRGITGIWIDEKEFDTPVRYINYIMKTNQLDKICKISKTLKDATDESTHDQSSSGPSQQQSSLPPTQ